MTNKLFIERMDIELKANAHKGNWGEWKPTKEEWLWEMQHHQAKLQDAIASKNKDTILEFSADVGNLAEKAFVTFGNPSELSVQENEKHYRVKRGEKIKVTKILSVFSSLTTLYVTNENNSLYIQFRMGEWTEEGLMIESRMLREKKIHLYSLTDALVKLSDILDFDTSELDADIPF